MPLQSPLPFRPPTGWPSPDLEEAPVVFRVTRGNLFVTKSKVALPQSLFISVRTSTIVVFHQRQKRADLLQTKSIDRDGPQNRRQMNRQTNKRQSFNLLFVRRELCQRGYCLTMASIEVRTRRAGSSDRRSQ